MKNKSFDEKFKTSCFTLSKDDIYEFDKNDNGPINNVISRITEHCFGVRLYDEEKISVEMYYINHDSTLKGELIELDVFDKDYFQLLLRFCIILSEQYKSVDALNAFNVFQKLLRGFMQKMGYFTVTDAELEPYKGKNIGMMAKSPIFRLRTINRTEFYQDLFNSNFCMSEDKGFDYVYLMLNEDTSLIKIGTSQTPKFREKTLQSEEPRINMIAKWRCDKNVEKQLHSKFIKKRERGEWFRLNILDLKEIEEFMSNL